jgi:sucrose-phosphate synthase
MIGFLSQEHNCGQLVQMLNNGLLVDPHDHKTISAALLKLVSDRSLWHDCRKNGLKNIHLFSWPEHCRSYLARIALCRLRHPRWEIEPKTSDESDELDSQPGSLCGDNDSLIRLSVDEDFFPATRHSADEEQFQTTSTSLENPDNILKSSQMKQTVEPQNEHETRKQEGVDSNLPRNNNLKPLVSIKIPQFIIKKRKKLVAFALDNYDTPAQKTTQIAMKAIKNILKAIRQGKTRTTGFILLSALTVTETLAMFKANNVTPQDFDALICGSGSRLYYPRDSVFKEENFDLDYQHHINYRWAYTGLRKTMPQLMSPDEDHFANKGERHILVEDPDRCNSHCLVFNVTDITLVRLNLQTLTFN